MAPTTSPISYANCIECGGLFVLHRRGRVPDEPACKLLECQKARHARRERLRAQIAPKRTQDRRQVPGVCAWCNEDFKGRSGQTLCSRQCRMDRTKAKYADSSGGRNRKHRIRRARSREGATVKVDRNAILNRDNWRCHICTTKINPQLKWPHPMSASIDHLIPLAQQGKHEPSNIAAAHLGCNIRKGDRGGGEQLMLVG